MEITIQINGQAVAVDATIEVYEYLDQADHKAENLAHEQRRHFHPAKSADFVGTPAGICESLTSTSSPTNVVGYIS